jgi:hypothetical protein
MELLASGSGTLFMLAGRLAVVHVSVELEHQVSVPGDGVIDATLVLVAAGFFGFEPNLLLLEGNLSRSVATLELAHWGLEAAMAKNASIAMIDQNRPRVDFINPLPLFDAVSWH